MAQARNVHEEVAQVGGTRQTTSPAGILDLITAYMACCLQCDDVNMQNAFWSAPFFFSVNMQNAFWSIPFFLSFCIASYLSKAANNRQSVPTVALLSLSLSGKWVSCCSIAGWCKWDSRAGAPRQRLSGARDASNPDRHNAAKRASQKVSDASRLHSASSPPCIKHNTTPPSPHHAPEGKTRGRRSRTGPPQEAQERVSEHVHTVALADDVGQQRPPRS